jgi:hypothetical protein
MSRTKNKYNSKNIKSIPSNKEKNKIFTNKINLTSQIDKTKHYPILGLLGILFSIYFLLEPDIRIEGRAKGELNEVAEKGSLGAASTFTFTFRLKNYSLRPGFINKVEIYPEGIAQTRFKILDIQYDQTSIYFLQTIPIKVRYSLLESTYTMGPPQATEGDTLFMFETLLVSLFDNFNSPITNTDGKSVLYYACQLQMKSSKRR